MIISAVGVATRDILTTTSTTSTSTTTTTTTMEKKRCAIIATATSTTRTSMTSTTATRRIVSNKSSLLSSSSSCSSSSCCYEDYLGGLLQDDYYYYSNMITDRGGDNDYDDYVYEKIFSENTMMLVNVDNTVSTNAYGNDDYNNNINNNNNAIITSVGLNGNSDVIEHIATPVIPVLGLFYVEKSERVKVAKLVRSFVSERQMEREKENRSIAKFPSRRGNFLERGEKARVQQQQQQQEHKKHQSTSSTIRTRGKR
ncbi:hypothetical protein M0802_013184 [Mischocyttarus mexicanus]|nr:hypothetical protein M0802_013184 [Mischocyttarus mexicanus]